MPGGETVENDGEVALEPLITVIAKVSSGLDQWCVLAQSGVAFDERVPGGIGGG